MRKITITSISKIHLNLVIPIYNEEEIIKVVVKDWIKTLDKLNINYRIKLYNDGSTDSTYEIIKTLKKDYPEIIEFINKENTGHGPTILLGYMQSLNSEWIFQVDSDNEMRASHFEKFWKAKDNYDLVIGKRVNRTSPLFRRLMTYTSYLVVRLFYGKGIIDVNSPYRLMRSSIFKEIFTNIPSDTFAPNILISGIATKKKLKIKNYDIQFDTRTTGINSLNSNFIKLFKVSIKSFYETIVHAWREEG